MIPLVFILIAIQLLIPAEMAEAHPMGNFSINHYSGIEVRENEIRVRYILDLAEIPTFQEMQEIDANQDGKISAAEQEAYLSRKVDVLASGLLLKVKEEEKALVPISQEITFPPGVGGLPTMKLSVFYRAELSFSEGEAAEVFYQDNNYPNRAGWKELAVAGHDGLTLIGSSLPSIGGELRVYPEDGIKSPPQVLETRFAFAVGPSKGAKAEPFNPRVTAFGKQEVSLGGKTLTSLMGGVAPNGPMVLFSLLVAFGLGILHAFTPGHGKTLVAAYLVGSRGTIWHAVLLGLIVTLSHTIGVFLLGLATLYLSKVVVPERLYPWLGLLSGLVILIIGFSLFRQRLQSLKHAGRSDLHNPADPQDHAHSHDHSHDAQFERSFSDLLGLGVTGGIIPCPSALVVLLSAIAFHQVGFGLLLIVAFSAGLAATLVGIGLLMVCLGGVMSRLEGYRSLSRILPIVSSGAVAMLGGTIAFGAWF